MSDIREDFEERAARMGHNLTCDIESETGDYRYYDTQTAWDMWQEAHDLYTQPQGAEAVRDDLFVQDLANKICKHLPKGFEIRLCMENGAQGADEYPNCDTCGASMDYMPWHYASETKRHLHSCDECWPKVSPARAHNDAGPVAWLAGESIFWHERTKVVAQQCGVEITPLYIEKEQ